MAESPIDLTLERIKRLEALMSQRFDAIDKRFDVIDERFDAVDKRFEKIETAFEKMVTILEAHHQRLEGIVVRLDRLVEQAIRARTEDTARMSDIERRLRLLEEQRPDA